MKSSNIGGQAVMEGIMMRHKDVYSVAVRKPDKEIEVKVEDYKSVVKCKSLQKLPILRGVFSFIDSLVVGTKCLMYSATFFEDEEDLKKREQLEGEEKEKELAKKEKADKALMTGTVILSVVLSVGLFIVLPYLLASLLRNIGVSETGVTLAEAGVRIVLFLAYMLLISKMQDIQRVFMYHGAEHKSIACYEAGKELTVENVRESCRFHPRCGTSFIFVMLIFSIIFSTVLSKIFPSIAQVRVLWMLLKLAFIPLLMGVGYEFIKYAGKHDNLLVKILSAPGLWMQRLTTKEPTDDIIEVGIESLKAVITDNPEDDEIK